MSPIVVCGAARSGKTTLCTILDQHEGLSTWSEPNALLRAGRAYRRNDLATARDATPRVIRHVRRLCLERQNAVGGARLIIESPIACFQIPFLAAVFPGLRVVHVCSNGRYVFARRKASEAEVLAAGIGDADNRNRMSEQFHQMFWWEIPAYLPRFVHLLVRPFAGHLYRRWFGVRYPGWRNDFRTLDESQIIARQWAKSVDAAMDGLAQLPDDAGRTIPFEEFLAHPGQTIEDLQRFCGVEPDARLTDISRAVAREVNERVAAGVEEPEPGLVDLLRPALRRLGYG